MILEGEKEREREKKVRKKEKKIGECEEERVWKAFECEEKRKSVEGFDPTKFFFLTVERGRDRKRD